MSLFGPPNVEKLKAKRDVKGLIKALGYEKDMKVRQAAAEALGQIGDAQAVEPLVRALKHRYMYSDEKTPVWEAAEEALLKIGDARVVEPLVAAAEVLGKIGDARAVWPLCSYTEDNVSAVRKAAVEALGKIGGERVVKSLASVLANQDSLIWSTQKALVKIGTAAVEPLLMTTLEAENYYIMRDRVGEVIKSLGWQPMNDVQRALMAVINRQWEQAVSLGAVAVKPLVAYVQCDEGHYNHDNKKAISALTKVLRSAATSIKSDDLRAVTLLIDLCIIS